MKQETRELTIFTWPDGLFRPLQINTSSSLSDARNAVRQSNLQFATRTILTIFSVNITPNPDIITFAGFFLDGEMAEWLMLLVLKVQRKPKRLDEARISPMFDIGSAYQQSGDTTLPSLSLAATFKWRRHFDVVCSGKEGISTKFLRKPPHMSLVCDLSSEAP